MKVGVLTFHHVLNYGAVLQAVSLFQAIQALGHEVEIIDYRPRKARLKYMGLGLRSGGPIRAMARKKKFFDYLRTGARLSGTTFYSYASLQAGLSDYESIIVGSDQVWNVVSYRGVDRAFFLDFLPTRAVRRIAYAPSVGEAGFEDLQRAGVHECLRHFDWLSARDEGTADVVEKCCGVRPAVVLDPAFLQLPERKEREQEHSEYILVYGLEVNPEIVNVSTKLQREKQLPIVTIGKGWHGVKREITDASPSEWVQLVQNASFLVTNSFHGVVYSIMNEVPFLALPHSKGSKRIKDLTLRFGQGESFLESPTDENCMINSRLCLDFGSTRATLRELRKQSINYLEVALSS